MSFTLKAGARQIDLAHPVCMGILNTTPDSFSDGSQLARAGSERFAVDVDLALARAENMLAEGAVFVDIGGESTRPGAEPVSLDEELSRVIPVVEAIRRNLDICISVDTSNPAVMLEAVAAGAELINDVRALSRADALPIAADSKAAICLMHMQGQPQTMQQDVSYSDVVTEVRDTLQQRVDACLSQGIDSSRLLIDPGFGFGKTVQHNFQLLKHLSSLQSLGLPLLVGMSRKSMIGAATGRDLHERLAGSVAAASLAVHNGAHVIRSHDVAATMDAIRVHCAYQDA